MKKIGLASYVTLWSIVILENLLVLSYRYEIASILWNQKVRYFFQKSPLPVPILSQLNPIYTLQPHFPWIQFMRKDLKFRKSRIEPKRILCAGRG
jgi:hypothetical protein